MLVSFSAVVRRFREVMIYGGFSSEVLSFSSEVLGVSSEALGFSSEVLSFSSEVLGFSLRPWALPLWIRMISQLNDPNDRNDRVKEGALAPS